MLPLSHARTQTLLKRLLCALILSFSFGIWAASSTYAQGSPPTFADQIGRLTLRAGQLIPALQSGVINQIGLWFEKWAFVIAPCIMLMAFIRVWHETSGGGVPMVFYFVRVFLVLVMLGVAIPVLQEMNDAGKVIAYGDEMAGNNGGSLLNDFYLAQRESFDTSYKLFTQGVFTVKVDGADFTVKPTVNTNNGTETLLGVVYDSQSTVRDFNNKFTDSSWSMPLMFSWLNVARGIIDFGDLWLIGLAGILLLVMKCVAPIMVAVAVDQKLAQKITYPYAWGCVVLTLIWPSVSLFIRGIAFMFGNVLMALGDSNELYKWNDQTLAAIRDPLFAQPLYTAGLVAFMMTVAGVCVWFTPVLAYRFSMGQIYEGVSQIAATTAGGIIGAGVEWYSANIASHLQQQAGTQMATEGYRATGVEARANKEAGMLRNQAGYVSGKASALSAAQASAGAAMAAGHAGMQTAYAIYGSAKIPGQTGYTEKLIESSRQREVDSVNAGNQFAQGQIRIGNAETSVGMATGIQNQVLDTTGQTFRTGFGGGGRLKGAGVGASLSVDPVASQIGLQKTENALNLMNQTGVFASQKGANQQGLTNTNVGISNTYATTNKNAAHETGDTLAGISMKQAQASAGAAYAGANTAIKGHAQAKGLNDQATAKEFGGRMEAAGINRDASISAAKLQALASVVSAVGNRVAREIEDGFELHY